MSRRGLRTASRSGGVNTGGPNLPVRPCSAFPRCLISFFTTDQSLTDGTLELSTHSDGTTTVNDGSATIVEKDVYASNGVVHILDNLLIPPGSPLFKATAEKWLLALNATVFVGMLRDAGLTEYVNGTGKNKEWTILAPADDVLNDIVMKRELSGLAEIKTELKTLLKYHIIPGILKPEDLTDGQLVGTELRPDSLKGGRMRLKVDVVGNGKKNKGDTGIGNGDLAFGGANVIAEPGAHFSQALLSGRLTSTRSSRGQCNHLLAFPAFESSPRRNASGAL